MGKVTEDDIVVGFIRKFYGYKKSKDECRKILAAINRRKKNESRK
jgi:hypothetical protein